MNMQMGRLFLVLSFVMAVSSSCIKDEPLNPEADILTFSLPEGVALSAATFNQENISVVVRGTADLSTVVPSITITEGATILPAADTPRDFTHPVTYTVTAADGKHSRTYTIQVVTYSPFKYSFENWVRLDSNYAYETPVEFDPAGQQLVFWDSSNKGIAIYQQHADPTLYPIHSTTQSQAGKYAAEMSTSKGPGSILGIINIPVVAGSLFSGVLNPLSALKNPLLATQFGRPCDEKPLRFQGYYYYRAGTGDYIDPKGQVLPGVKDTCAIYSVFYKVDKDTQVLDGTNVLTHPNIVAVAMLPGNLRAASPGSGLVPFDIPFEYKGEAIDFEKNQYKLAVIFSSSYYGDRYEGAPGSRLVVDEVEIITETSKP